MTISNKQAYYEAMAKIESFIEKGFDRLTEAEEAQLASLSEAVEAWEEQAYPMPMQPDFKAILLNIMETNHYTQRELAKSLAISTGYLSSILSDTKVPNVKVLKSLHSEFKIDGNLLLDSL